MSSNWWLLMSFCLDSGLTNTCLLQSSKLLKSCFNRWDHWTSNSLFDQQYLVETFHLKLCGSSNGGSTQLFHFGFIFGYYDAMVESVESDWNNVRTCTKTRLILESTWNTECLYYYFCYLSILKHLWFVRINSPDMRKRLPPVLYKQCLANGAAQMMRNPPRTTVATLMSIKMLQNPL